jgi:predicted Fe-S protein YdhL (DUF1289 family)
MDEVESPCIGKCGLTNEGTCQGCLRQVREIISWPRLTDDQKRAVIKDLEIRKATQQNKRKSFF